MTRPTVAPPPPSAGTPRWRTLLPWTAAVLAAHGAAMQWPLESTAVLAPSPLRLVTRTVEPAPAVAPTPPPPAPAARTVSPGTRTPAPVARPRRTGPPPPPAPPPEVERVPLPEAEPAPASDGFGVRSRDARPDPSPDPPPVAEVAAAPEPAAPASAPERPQVLAIPVPSRLRYEVQLEARGLTLNGQAQLDWRHDGTDYEARLELNARFLPTRVQRSVGRITDAGLAPTLFSDQYRGEQATHFRREQGRVTFSNNRPDAPLVAGMQDRLSVVVQLAVLVGGEPARYPPGTRITIPTASTREAEAWVFEVVGEEDLRLPGGAVRGLKVQRLPRKEFDQKVELWLAPRMDYAPVRLRLTNPNGDSVDQRWSATDKGG